MVPAEPSNPGPAVKFMIDANVDEALGSMLEYRGKTPV
jgi:hypothetical protein